MNEEDEQLAKAYYAKLEEFGKQANAGTMFACEYATATAAKLLKEYLTFRGYKLPRKCSLEYLSMILMELDTRDEKTRCGLSLMLWNDKVATSPEVDWLYSEGSTYRDN